MEIFSRTEMIIGNKGLRLLSAARVAVFGLGGVGAAAAEALARSGIGNMTLIDFDHVAVTDINRQLIAFESTLNQPKVQVMATRIRDINPCCKATTYQEKYHKETADRIFDQDFDYVVDAIDMVSAKVDLIHRCYVNEIPIITAMGAGNKLKPELLEVADISQTHTCPLARIVRLKLRQQGITEGVSVVFSGEKPVRKSGGKQRIPGSSAFVPPVCGYIMASVVVRNLINER